MTMLNRLAALFLCCPTLTHAALTLSTRVIYDEAQGEVTVPVRYPVDGAPILMQTWLDDGGDDLRPEMQNPPFLLTPAVARIDSGQTQTIRILKTRNDLPQDRESLFYLNVLEVPPVATDGVETGHNALHIAAHTRVKFFYRPKGLRAAPETAPGQLWFSLEQAATYDATGGHLHVRVHNPSAYHVTLRALSLHGGSATQHNTDATSIQTITPALAARDTDQLAPVLAPMSEQVIALPLAATARLPLPTDLSVQFSAINDYGRDLPLQSPLVSSS